MAITTGDIINDTDIFDKFASAIAANANAGIVYGTDKYHFTDLPLAGRSRYGGTTAGLTQMASGISAGDTVTAPTIVNYITSQAAAYCRIRNMSVTRNVSASGGPATSQSTRAGITHMTDAYAVTFTIPASTGVNSGDTISAPALNNFYTNCYNNYLTARNTTHTYSYTVCHNSCHSSCHLARGRR